MREEIVYCDNCGEIVERMGGFNWEGVIRPYKAFSKLPFDVESANKGESGVVCKNCIRKKRGR